MPELGWEPGGLGSPVGSPGRRGWHWGAGRCHVFSPNLLVSKQRPGQLCCSPWGAPASEGLRSLPHKGGSAGVVPQVCRPPGAPTFQTQARPATFLLRLFSRGDGDKLGSVCSQGREEPFLEIPNLSSPRQSSGLETGRKWGRLGKQAGVPADRQTLRCPDPAPASQ